MNSLWTQSQAAMQSGTSLSWAIALGLTFAFTALFWFLLKFVSNQLRIASAKTDTKWDDLLVDLIDGLKKSVIFIITFSIISDSLPQVPTIRKIVLTLVVLAVSAQVIIWGLHIITNLQARILSRRIESDPSSVATLALLYTGLKVALFSLVALIGLSNLGVDITALLAGLGVGGIAVALAAQNILGDLLASLSIVLDKPFVVGDFIIAGDQKGTVEHIGIKTTRLRSLSGEQIVISNKDLLESRVQNFKRMWTRRVVQKFGVVYSTPKEALSNIPNWIRKIIESRPTLKFDRCHFCSYGSSSLDFEFVFFVSNPDYNTYMDLQQEVLLEIFQKFQEEKVDFAFPTQSIFIEKIPTGAPN